MVLKENEFFRQATLRLCGNLDFEIALQECLLYLRGFMPADCFHLVIYDRDLEALRIIAIASPDEARRVNNVIPLDQEGIEIINSQLPMQAHILDLDENIPITQIMSKTGIWEKHSVMVMHLLIKGFSIGNIVLYAKGYNRFTEKDLSLFSILNEPFAIALSNALRYDELNRLKDIMADDIKYLHSKLQHTAEDIVIGEDFGLSKVMEMVKSVAPLNSPVLLLGETGVGKEVIANTIHRLSKRKEGPFIQVNCGAIPDTLIDSELFGHEKGAFTGAVARKRGCFERANGGTIFLDEVAELPLQAQVRMLRVLQDGEFLRVGGMAPIKVDIRIIAATHQNMQEMVEKKLFRSDLWFRLHVFPIHIPPLRERTEDIPALIDFFIDKKAKELQIPEPPKLAPGAINTLKAYSWPGNVRELENVVERALILEKNGLLTFNDLVRIENVSEHKSADNNPEDFLSLDILTRQHIKKALKITDGKVHGQLGAAQLLGLNPSTLRHRMRKLGIRHGRG
jgi:formate hydrogenlyase transcriptional activator